jgi:hypothetical protein
MPDSAADKDWLHDKSWTRDFVLNENTEEAFLERVAIKTEDAGIPVYMAREQAFNETFRNRKK